MRDVKIEKRPGISMVELVLGVLGLVGLVVGSFLNVCTYRLPRRESIVQPGSRCTQCDTPIRWFDLVPVLSFVWLRGRCRVCEKRISWRYPVIELITGLIFGVAAIQIGWGIELGAVLVCCCVLIVASVIDWEHGIIPNSLSALLLIAGGIFSVVWHIPPPWIAMWGSVVGAGLLLAMGLLGRFLFKRESMGGGDVKLAAGIGVFVGDVGMLQVLFLACVAGTLVGLMGRLTGHLTAFDRVPFAPFLSLGAGLQLLFFPMLL